MRVGLSQHINDAISSNEELLKEMARRYIWWKEPDVAFEMPLHILAYVMSVGHYEDMQLLTDYIGDEVLRDILKVVRA